MRKCTAWARVWVRACLAAAPSGVFIVVHPIPAARREAHSNPKAKRDTKKEDLERQREEAARKRAEAKRLAAEEEAALAAAAKKKAAKPTPPKVCSGWGSWDRGESM